MARARGEQQLGVRRHPRVASARGGIFDWGAEGTGNGQFKTPVGLAFDSEGDLWVADSGNNRVQRFTSEGSYLSQVGTSGNENGQFQ
jgi:secreted PhoX family phosphatase